MGGKQILRCLLEKWCLMPPSLCYNHRYKIDTQTNNKSCIFKNSSRKWPLLVKKCVYLHKTNRTTPKTSCRYTNGGTNDGRKASKTM